MSGRDLETTPQQDLDSLRSHSHSVKEDWYNESVESVLKGKAVRAEGCGHLQGLEVLSKLDSLEAEMLLYIEADTDRETDVVKDKSRDWTDGGGMAEHKSHDKSTIIMQGLHDQEQSHDQKEGSHDQRYLIQGPLYDHTESICDVAPAFDATPETLTKSPNIIIFPPPGETERLLPLTESPEGSSARKLGQPNSGGHLKRKQRVKE